MQTMTLEKLSAQDSQSLNIKTENIAKLKALFPEILTEKGIDFSVLKQLLGDEIEEADERYSFTWNGKARARRLAKEITEAVAEEIGQLKNKLAPAVCRVVFRDAGFVDDVAKVNAVQALKQFGIDDVKSL
jgi:hypothetical protein